MHGRIDDVRVTSCVIVLALPVLTFWILEAIDFTAGLLCLG